MCFFVEKDHKELDMCFFVEKDHKELDIPSMKSWAVRKTTYCN